VGERPQDPVVYAALGRAALNWAAYDAIVEALRTLADDETLILQTGRPVGVLKTHPEAPKVLSAVNNTVGR
jgi:urocanate hydratase